MFSIFASLALLPTPLGLNNQYAINSFHDYLLWAYDQIYDCRSFILDLVILGK